MKMRGKNKTDIFNEATARLLSRLYFDIRGKSRRVGVRWRAGKASGEGIILAAAAQHGTGSGERGDKMSI